MANTLKLDHKNGQIVMDRTFAKKSEDTMSTEYAHLQNVRRDYPNYTVVRHTIKKNSNKETYKGLTYDFMRYYISKYEPKETKKAVEKELEDLIEISKCHAKARRYPTIKKWFLEKYPNVLMFGMTEVELAAYKKSQEEKAKREAEKNATRESAENAKPENQENSEHESEENANPETQENQTNVIHMPQQTEEESQSA